MYQKRKPDAAARGWKIWNAESEEESPAVKTAGLSSLEEYAGRETLGDVQKLIAKAERNVGFYSASSFVDEMTLGDYVSLLSDIVRLHWKIKSSPPLSKEAAQPENGNSVDNVEVDAPEGYLLRIKTPLLYGGKYSGAYLSAAMVEDAIKGYEEQKGKIVIPPQEPLVMVFSRYISSANRQICDNDNYDQRRVTNSVAGALGVSDAYDTMAFFYHAKNIGGGEGYSVVSLLTQKEYVKHISDFV